MEMQRFQEARSVRREFRSRTGRFRAGVLAPVMAVRVEPSEGGMLTQNIAFELDPIAGRMITPMYMEMVAVFVPVQAIDAIKDPAFQYAGMTEVVRQKLLTGASLFALEAEGEISKRCKVNPRSIGGVKMVSEAVRLGHNAAVNFLRTRRYDKATKVLHSNTAVTPAIVTQTVLDLLNGVLDPDDRINGAVTLTPNPINILLPVEGIGVNTANTQVPAAGTAREAGGTGTTAYPLSVGTATASTAVIRTTGTTAATARADVYARLNGTFGGGTISLDDLHNAETADRLVREMRSILEEHPQEGEEMIARWAHGLKVEDARTPWIISEQRREVGRQVVNATDSAGVTNDTMRTDSAGVMSFTMPVPTTELGGIIYTFCMFKPDETLAQQPHPNLSDTWVLRNHVADQMMLDPVAVLNRQLDSEIATGLETNVAFYTGYNALLQNYIDYGLSRQLNPTTVANKTAVWQYALPLSVSPSGILYPASLPQTPFLDQLAEVVTYTITSQVRLNTPIVFGPTPVEQMAIIDTATLLTN